MNILFLTQILPYPPDAGPRVKTWHVLRYLAAQGHRVTLISYVRPEEIQHLPAVEEVCERVITVPITRSRVRDAVHLVRSLLSARPFFVVRDDLPAMRAAVRDAVADGRMDVIHADQLGMAQFALLGRDAADRDDPPAALFDAHNTVSLVLERMAETVSRVFRPLLRFEAARVRRYERGLVAAFDHTLTVTEIDRAARTPDGQLREKITTVPIAVDTEALIPAPPPSDPLNILTLGTLHYPPNADGIRWFLNEVFPILQAQVPGVSLTIVGKNPPADFIAAAARDPAIETTGYVPDLGPYVARCALVVVPVRAGGGMRVRVLEAFARARPVVTTSVGLEGIAAQPGKDVLLADSTEEFADQVRRVLASPELQRSLSQAGRHLAERCYDWREVLKEMDRVYARWGRGNDG